MATGFATLASEYAGNLTSKSKRAMVLSTGAVAVLSFAAMVSAAYTADHINKSSCDKSADGRLKSAYKWSWVTASISGITFAGMVAILIKTAMTKTE